MCLLIAVTIREITEEIEISYGSCQVTFTNVLNMKQVAAKFVPKLLNVQQKMHCITIAEQMFADVTNDPDLFKCNVIGDKMWVYGYNIKMKAQPSQWKFSEKPTPKKRHQV